MLGDPTLISYYYPSIDTIQIPSRTELTLEPGEETTVSVLACNQTRNFVTTTNLTLYHLSGPALDIETSTNQLNGILDYFETRRRGFSVQEWETNTLDDSLACLEVRVRLYNNQSLDLAGVGIEVSTTDHTTTITNIFNVSFLKDDMTIPTNAAPTTEQMTSAGFEKTETPTQPNPTTHVITQETETTAPSTIGVSDPSCSVEITAAISTGIATSMLLLVVAVLLVVTLRISLSMKRRYRG